MTSSPMQPSALEQPLQNGKELGLGQCNAVDLSLALRSVANRETRDSMLEIAYRSYSSPTLSPKDNSS